MFQKDKWTKTLLMYGATLALLVVCSAMGYVGIGMSRYIFIVGSIALAYYAWKESPGKHLEIVIILFAFAPLVRRLIDYGSGFDLLGFMLSGPLLAMAVPCVELVKITTSKGYTKNIGPYLLAGLCVVYGLMLDVFTGEYTAVMSQGIKWLIPVMYGLWIMQKSSDINNDMINHAAKAFLIVTPIMGIYGVVQYVDPQPWDRYWMLYSQMGSIGIPEPFQVRVFSTMNSPASFATFATAGLLVFSFTRQGWQAVAVGITVALALMLSQYRTAWISLVVGLGYGWLFNATRGRSSAIAIVGVAAALFAVTIQGPIGDVISQRFDTFSQGSQDGSAIERWSEYVDFYAQVNDYIVGKGLSVLTASGITTLVAIDGTIISCYLAMGIFVGTICLFALSWAALKALGNVGMFGNALHISTGAVVLGMIISMPLAGISAGESGFLFWTFIGITIGTRNQRSLSSFRIPNIPRPVNYFNTKMNDQ